MTVRDQADFRRIIKDQCIAARIAYEKGFTSSLPVAVFLESMLGGKSPCGIQLLLQDQERMDHLDDEEYREECWRDAGMPSGAPRSLFRTNNPITREVVDEAIEQSRAARDAQERK